MIIHFTGDSFYSISKQITISFTALQCEKQNTCSFYLFILFPNLNVLTLQAYYSMFDLYYKEKANVKNHCFLCQFLLMSCVRTLFDQQDTMKIAQPLLNFTFSIFYIRSKIHQYFFNILIGRNVLKQCIYFDAQDREVYEICTNINSNATLGVFCGSSWSQHY